MWSVYTNMRCPWMFIFIHLYYVHMQWLILITKLQYKDKLRRKDKTDIYNLSGSISKGESNVAGVPIYRTEYNEYFYAMQESCVFKNTSAFLPPSWHWAKNNNLRYLLPIHFPRQPPCSSSPSLLRRRLVSWILMTQCDVVLARGSDLLRGRRFKGSWILMSYVSGRSTDVTP